MESIILETVVSGCVAGLLMGLTGSGSVVAMPLLVYFLQLRPHQAICVSMVTIGGVAAMSVLANLGSAKRHRMALKPGLLAAATGMLGAPFGAFMSRYFSETWLLLLFSGTVAVFALHLLLSQREISELNVPKAAMRKKIWVVTIGTIGFGAGIVSGLLGIGTGLILVPAFILISGLTVRRAVATSLIVIALISISSVSTHLIMGQRLPVTTTVLFAFGGVSGFVLSSTLKKQLPHRHFQRVFAVCILLMSIMITAVTLRKI